MRGAFVCRGERGEARRDYSARECQPELVDLPSPSTSAPPGWPDVPTTFATRRCRPGSNGSVPSTDVAEWAGHIVAVLNEVYAKCLDGRQHASRERIQEVLGGADRSWDVGISRERIGNKHPGSIVMASDTRTGSRERLACLRSSEAISRMRPGWAAGGWWEFDSCAGRVVWARLAGGRTRIVSQSRHTVEERMTPDEAGSVMPPPAPLITA